MVNKYGEVQPGESHSKDQVLRLPWSKIVCKIVLKHVQRHSAIGVQFSDCVYVFQLLIPLLEIMYSAISTFSMPLSVLILLGRPNSSTASKIHFRIVSAWLLSMHESMTGKWLKPSMPPVTTRCQRTCTSLWFVSICHKWLGPWTL